MTSSCSNCGGEVLPKFRRTRISTIGDPLWYHECSNCLKDYLVEDSDLFYSNRVADVIMEYKRKFNEQNQEYM